jgi:hypothetical protein
MNTLEKRTENESVLYKKGNRFIKVLKQIALGLVLVLFVAFAVEYLLHVGNVDHFFTLSTLPVSGRQSNLSDVFGNDEAYTRATNYRGEEIFRNPTTAFGKMEKECAPLLNQMQKEKHLPSFSTTTYRKYLYVLSYPPYYPGDNVAQINKAYFTCEFYLNSTQLLFFPKPPRDDSK